MQQALDFATETEVLAEIVSTLSDQQLQEVTQFRDWTIEDVVGHLHLWNQGALISLTQPENFPSFFEPVAQLMMQGGSLKDYEREVYRDCRGQDLVGQWIEVARDTAAAFQQADPSQRVAWAGPSMSARSSISARQMETWAHGHEVFDCLGVVRVEGDRLRNIVVLGINTFGWTFQVRSQEPPGILPSVNLSAPSGELWCYGDSETDLIAGEALEFAQVVTQTRHWRDTQLTVEGGVARQWMAHAQCFFGPPTEPPEQGTRYLQRA